MPSPTPPPTSPDPFDSESTPIRFPDYETGTKRTATTTTKSGDVDGIQHSYGSPGETKSRGSTYTADFIDIKAISKILNMHSQLRFLVIIGS